MKKYNNYNKELLCLKTGGKAKIIEFFDRNEISYVKVKINIKFENSSFQILKTVEIDDIKKDFDYI